MNAILDLLRNWKVSAAVGFVLGLIIGLVLLGWIVWPVQYYDAAPQHLQADYAADYLRMAIESYRANPADVVMARERWKGLGPAAAKALTTVRANPKTLDPGAIDAFVAAAGAPGGATTPGAPLPTKAATAAGSSGGGDNTMIFVAIGVMCLITLAIGAALVYFLFLRPSKGAGKVTPAMQAQQAARQAQATDYAALGEEPPMAQFMASYKVGDDLFDDSFSVDSASGEFMGECGVGISETIGVGDPKKVTAFEVWLFDKNDIQTVTRVLLSAHAFQDEAIKSRLKAKGDVELAEVGKQVVLETQTLQLVARIVEMTYGEGALPQNSFFDQFVLELAIWPK